MKRILLVVAAALAVAGGASAGKQPRQTKGNFAKEQSGRKTRRTSARPIQPKKIERKKVERKPTAAGPTRRNSPSKTPTAGGKAASVAVTEEQIKAARAELLEGVSAIRTEGLPGSFICASSSAFGVVAGKNWDGTYHPVVAAAFYGKGRVIAFGHGSFFEALPFQSDTAQFLVNAAGWVGQGKKSPLAVYRWGGAAKGLSEAGVDVVEVNDLDAALASPAILAGAGAFDTEEKRLQLRDYLAKGGGLMTSAIGWGWKNIAQNYTGFSCLALHYPDEKTLAPLGILATDLGIGHTGDEGYLTGVDFPLGSDLPSALRIAGKYPDGIEEETLRKQVAKTLTMAADAYPPDDSAAYAAFRELANHPLAKKMPSRETPVTSADFYARVRIVLEKNAWLADPVKVWPADPSAATYPGLMAKGAKPVKGVELQILTDERRWHSTGLFANAGEAITVRLPESALGLGLQVRVGTTDDDIASVQETWIRSPVVSETIALTKATQTFASPFGGFVYIVVPFSVPKGDAVRVRIDGAYRAPHFKRGRDTNESWAKSVSSFHAPQAEIEGYRMVITLPSTSLAKLTDPEWVTKFWDDANDLDVSLSALGEPFDYKQRICADAQLTAGFLHNGYPMMCHVSADGNSALYDKSNIEAHGEWGVLHELGHNHQNSAWTFGKAAEVTVNIFTLYCTDKLLGIKPRDAFGEWTSVGGCDRRVSGWVDRGKPWEEWGAGPFEGPFLGLETFTRLQEVYGWELFEKLFAQYRQPGENLPKNDQERMDQWATRLSAMYEADFADYFEAWSWPISSEAKAECAKYPKLSDERLFRLLR